MMERAHKTLYQMASSFVFVLLLRCWPQHHSKPIQHLLCQWLRKVGRQLREEKMRQSSHVHAHARVVVAIQQRQRAQKCGLEVCLGRVIEGSCPIVAYGA